MLIGTAPWSAGAAAGEHPRPEDGMMSMQRTRRARGGRAVAADAGPSGEGPIPLDPLSLITGIAPGITLEGTVSDGRVPAGAPRAGGEGGRLPRGSAPTP